MENKFASWRGGINVFGDALIPDVFVAEVGDCFNQMLERAS